MTLRPEDLGALARRAVACKNWKWLPGMLGWRTTHDGRQVRVRFVESVEDQELVDPRIDLRKPSNTLIVTSGHVVVDGWHEVSTILPDLRDPATLGCLLALVREAWGEPHMSLGCRLVPHYGKWEWAVTVLDEPKIIPVYAWTEAEALVAALEAAP